MEKNAKNVQIYIFYKITIVMKKSKIVRNKMKIIVNNVKMTLF